MDPDEAAYRRSVRNTLKVLGVVVVVLAAALALTAYFDVSPNTFQTRTLVATPQPFILSLSINTTSVAPEGRVAISAWINATATGNVTAASVWAFNQHGLVTPCASASFPMGVGVMQGHYTQDNYSLGVLMAVSQPPAGCPEVAQGAPPSWFYFPSSQSSRVLVEVGGAPQFWVLQTGFSFGHDSVGLPRLAPGVYTAVAADEWGDFVLTNFRVT